MNTGTRLVDLGNLESLKGYASKQTYGKNRQKYYTRAVYKIVGIDKALREEGKVWVNYGDRRAYIVGTGLNPIVKEHGKSIDIEVVDAPTGAPNLIRLHSLNNEHGDMKNNKLGIMIAPKTWVNASLKMKSSGVITESLRRLGESVYSI